MDNQNQNQKETKDTYFDVNLKIKFDMGNETAQITETEVLNASEVLSRIQRIKNLLKEEMRISEDEFNTYSNTFSNQSDGEYIASKRLYFKLRSIVNAIDNI
jgi:hypothetical protein